ncbi:MAG: methyltransferase RsmF C-terminal domain-like protein [Flavobacteriales bacterium]
MAKDRARKRQVTTGPLVLPPAVLKALGDEAPLLLKALSEAPPVSIRRNPLRSALHQGSPVPWCVEGRYLEQRPVFTLDPHFHAGCYYVQEASSMLLEQAFRACGPIAEHAVALDLCAAPGGKTTHLAALLPPSALLVANEPVRARQAALQENLWKWGRPNVVVTGSLPADFAPLGEWCDLILVDAPCSGEGMFRKDHFARAQWKEELVESCALLQVGILADAWAALKPGGHLIYSTCTWEEKENEFQVQRLIDLGATYVPVSVDQKWGVTVGDRGLRCYPHRVRGEGFFLSVLRKSGEFAPRSSRPSEAQPLDVEIAAWLKDPEYQCIVQQDGIGHLLALHWAGLMQELMSTVRVLSPGIPAVQAKGVGVVPPAALALSTALNKDNFNQLELPLKEALAYLRGESLSANGATGVSLVQFEGSPLGWAHGAGNRWNNAWPNPWRIRMR